MFRVEADAVVDDGEGDVLAAVAQRDFCGGRVGVPDGVRQGRLADAQQRDLVRGRQRNDVAFDREARGDPVPGAGGRAQPFQRVGQCGVVERGRRQGDDEPAGFGEVVRGGLTSLFDVAGGVARRLGQRPFGCAQQELNARQALGEGVVDLVGQPLALGEHSRLVLGFGEVGTGGGELLDQISATFAFAVQRLIPPDDGDRDGGAECRADRGRRDEGTLVRGERGDRRQRGHDHRDQAVTARQQMQLQEIQREGDPDTVGGQHQQDQPPEAHRDQPPPGGPPGRPDARQERTGRVHHGAGHRRRHDRSRFG